MKFPFLLAVALLAPIAALAQQPKTPVSVGRWGKDEVGSLFEASFKRQLSRSSFYEPATEGEKGVRFFVDFVTEGVGGTKSDNGDASAVSVVIQQMGLPNSYPVPDMWYHKLIIVDRSTADAIAKKLLDDMAARWCSYIKNSVGGCPKETLEPKLNPD
jgi:hypothetical protein